MYRNGETVFVQNHLLFLRDPGYDVEYIDSEFDVSHPYVHVRERQVESDEGPISEWVVVVSIFAAGSVHLRLEPHRWTLGIPDRRSGAVGSDGAAQSDHGDNGADQHEADTDHAHVPEHARRPAPSTFSRGV